MSANRHWTTRCIKARYVFQHLQERCHVSALVIGHNRRCREGLSSSPLPWEWPRYDEIFMAEKITEPPSDDKFGLNASPFLLAATIRFHLETANVDQIFDKELNDNLYVDNLLITAESTQEGIRKYQMAKKIFKELNMKLREFISNDSKINKTIKKEDKSQLEQPKLLGIMWNTSSDNFTIKCNIQILRKITKRSLLHANASIYDPLGWLAPLMIRNKVFLQSLWKKDYSWDEELIEEDQGKLIKLCTEITEFEKQIPRKVADRKQKHRLVVFSDASSTAMATCAYLWQNEDHHLLVAKSKPENQRSSHDSEARDECSDTFRATSHPNSGGCGKDHCYQRNSPFFGFRNRLNLDKEHQNNQAAWRTSHEPSERYLKDIRRSPTGRNWCIPRLYQY